MLAGWCLAEGFSIIEIAICNAEVIEMRMCH